RKGMLATIVPTSETGYAAVQIQQYIQNAVETWDPAPEFVLIGGDSGSVPVPTENWALTDCPYGNVDGDQFIELHVGRFPASSLTQIELMVEKTLIYERTPTTDESYYRSAALLIAEDYDDDDWLHYFGDAQWEAALMTSSEYEQVDILSVATTPNQTDVFESLLLEGLSFSGFHGQIGGTVGWSGFNVVPDQLDNGPMLPVLVSYTCSTLGTPSAGGEQWMKAGSPGNPRGGVAFVGQTVSCSYCAHWRSALRRGFYGHIFLDTGENDRCTMGEAVETARLNYYDEFHQMEQYLASTLYGDPELNLWTKVPADVAIDHPPTVARGEIEFSVTATEDGGCREGIQIAITSDEGVFAVETTGEDGQVTFTVDSSADEILYITATGRNVRPYEAEIEVGGDAAQTGDDDDITGDDDDTTAPPDDDVTDDGDDDDDIVNEPLDTEGSTSLDSDCSCSSTGPRPAIPAALTAILALLFLRRRIS
ncbi:MAG: C25 family cysteine peptidase, partial [Myxococcota bacterium]|nr:C25 family cysteine peptidase [Myxococcota bacterium]